MIETLIPVTSCYRPGLSETSESYICRLVNIHVSNTADTLSPLHFQYRWCYRRYFWKGISIKVLRYFFGLIFRYQISNTSRPPRSQRRVNHLTSRAKWRRRRGQHKAPPCWTAVSWDNAFDNYTPATRERRAFCRTIICRLRWRCMKVWAAN